MRLRLVFSGWCRRCLSSAVRTIARTFAVSLPKSYTPASSPAFNYAFRRDDETFKVGVNFYFNAPPPPASSLMFVKALPAK